MPHTKAVPCVLLVAAGMCVVTVVRAYRTGTIEFRLKRIAIDLTKEYTPFRFWAAFSGSCALVIAFLGLGLYTWSHEFPGWLIAFVGRVLREVDRWWF